MRILLISLLAFASIAAEETRLVWQPVQRYLIHKQDMPVQLEGTKRLNSFTRYTHIGTDFGFHGPAEHEIEWVSDEIHVRLGQQPDAWAGMWHSLAGHAKDLSRVMDFTRAYPEAITPENQPRISAVMLNAGGRGRIKLEIKSGTQQLRWSQLIELTDEQPKMHVQPVASELMRDAKFLIWTAEPGADVTVKGLYLGVEVPQLPWDAYAFLASYAKLSRCYTMSSGFVRDRAHIDDGAFESVSATGMFALATAAAAQSPLNVVRPEYARWVLAQTHQAVRKLGTARGLLPHFVWQLGSEYQIHPNTEYSTVDTAIYCQSMLQAAQMLGDAAVMAEIEQMVTKIDFGALRLPSGQLSHGLHHDGKTLLEFGWGDWGGETVLVSLFERMGQPNHVPPLAQRPGSAWQGSGFISEIQSLFHPDFDSDEGDAHDGVHWMSVRRLGLGAQRAYFPRTMPHSLAAKLGIYGLSAGENQFGNAYYVGGTELPDQQLIHPHYILMSATVAEKSGDVLALLERMEKAGYFLPWGMVENLTADGRSHLAMEGGLNAGFEALGAYHLLTKHRGIPDTIYEASRKCAMIRQAMKLYYP